MADEGTDIAVRMTGIVKRFPGIVANDGVEFEARVGEVHALLGENGAGKSTLSNILTGLYRPDEGHIFLQGVDTHFASPRAALDAGIGMVHQHFRLVSSFSVAENIVLGDDSTDFLLDSRSKLSATSKLLQRLVTLFLLTKTETLHSTEQQLRVIILVKKPLACTYAAV